MKYYIKLCGVLFLIAFVSTVVLAFTYTITSPIVAENQKQQEQNARASVLAGADMFEKRVVEDFTFFVGKEKEQIVGYAFTAQGSGYSGKIKTMVGVDKDFVVKAIEVVSQAETPGLGANSTKPEFQNQFQNKTEQQAKLVRDGGTVQSLTGATITSRAICSSVSTGVAKLKEVYYKQGETE